MRFGAATQPFGPPKRRDDMCMQLEHDGYQMGLARVTSSPVRDGNDWAYADRHGVRRVRRQAPSERTAVISSMFLVILVVTGLVIVSALTSVLPVKMEQVL